jgi:hypothetical protein
MPELSVSSVVRLSQVLRAPMSEKGDKGMEGVGIFELPDEEDCEKLKAIQARKTIRDARMLIA